MAPVAITASGSAPTHISATDSNFDATDRHRVAQPEAVFVIGVTNITGITHSLRLTIAFLADRTPGIAAGVAG